MRSVEKFNIFTLLYGPRGKNNTAQLQLVNLKGEKKIEVIKW